MVSVFQTIWIQFLLKLTRHVDSQVSISGRHSTQVARLARLTARKMGCSMIDTELFYWAAMLHDIGKIGVPDSILKKPSSLSEKEWIFMRLHPTIGASIVKSLNFVNQIAPVIYSHQEKYDGSGYPEGLKGEDILLGARILCVVDAYDAMTDDRVYRKALSHDEAVTELKCLSGRDFDPQVVKPFLEIVNPYVM